jgi:uncharacterized membrane protein YraQ (UPF0718 family)
MMALAVGALLWVIVAVLVGVAALRSASLVETGFREGALDFLRLTPRVAIGVVGSGYVAAVLPPEVLASVLGPKSGILGTAIATLAGALTPGGPVVGFSVGVAALKSGAAAPQVIAYTTAWALFAIQRVASYEVVAMPASVVWLRVLVSIPVPFLAAFGAMLIGKP